jgi:hypothetical protein
MVGKIRRIKSFHEAGHAVIARKLGVEVSNLTMRPTGPDNTAGVETISVSWLARTHSTSEQVIGCENDAIVALAGMTAQARSHPHLQVTFDNPEFASDIQNARRMTANIIMILDGKSSEIEKAAPLSRNDVKKAKVKFDQILQRTYALVDAHWPAIERVARALERHDRLDPLELDALIERTQYRPKTAG